MKKVFFLPYSEASLREMLVLAPALLDQGLEPVLGLSGDMAARLGDNRQPAGIRRVIIDETRVGRGQGAAFALARGLRPTLLRDLCLDVLEQRAHLKEARQTLDSLAPCALLAGSDRKAGATLAFIKNAKQLGLPVFLLRFGISGQDWFPRRKWDSHKIGSPPHRPAKRLIQRLLPDQVQVSPAGPLLFYPPARTLALAMSGLLLPNPWMEGGGLSDWVLAAGQEDKETLLAGGVEPGKILLTGIPSHDELYEVFQNRQAIRQALAEQYDLDPDRPLVACAVPQYLKQHLSRPEEYWQKLEELFAALGQSAGQTLLSLHPRSNPEQYRDLAGKYDLPISDEPLFRILPAADLFQSTFSSTVANAVIFGIPVALYDFYGQQFDMFAHLDGVEVSRSLDALQKSLTQLLSDRVFYDAARRAQTEAAALMALLDGRAVGRIVDAIKDKCEA